MNLQSQSESPVRTPVPTLARPPFHEVYQAHCSYVWHTLRRLGVPERDLEDSAHDVFIVVHRKLCDYDPSRPMKPWLFGISMRVASDYRGKARNRRELISDELPEPDQSGPNPEKDLEQARTQAIVAKALEELDFKHRVVLVMHDINGHTMSEIADELEVSANTLYSRLRTARAKFGSAVRRGQLLKGGASA